MANARYRGILNAYNPVKGIGFIRREKGKDVFVLYSDFVTADGDSAAVVGTQIEFELEEPQSPKGPRAKNVIIVG
ncbi:cold shock domain-containing protein [Janthinobacterium sp. TND4EL3]|jgi:CspA family cold shock protein|uniref:cold shock domain-containing protein n=1 Tax=Janthinobacterium sp. TND4EL3 TaxID=1907311 RepID=UPI000970D4E3|nr:cold shock domain-containing protein [Janthinobacterium sp. TND4EL3]